MSRKKQYFPEYLLRRFYVVDATKPPSSEGYYISLKALTISGNGIKGYVQDSGNAKVAMLNCKQTFNITFEAVGYKTATFTNQQGMYLQDTVYPMFPVDTALGAFVNWNHSIVSDLDTHVIIVDKTSQQKLGEVNYANKTVTIDNTTVKLDIDDRGSNNGETITFDSQDSNHIYYFIVFNYSGRSVVNDNRLSSSDAVYRITLPNGQPVITIQCPTSGDGRFWEVFSMVGNSNQVTQLNNITDNNTYQITSI